MSARGTVTRDGAGAPGVAVTDGSSVVRTGPDGSFELPGAGAFVSVVRPAGETSDPWYAAPAEDLAFELEPWTHADSFVQVTDLHLSLGDPSFGAEAGDATFFVEDGALRERIVTTPEVLDRLFAELAGVAPLVIATGDVTNSGSREEYAALVDVLARSPVPVIVMPGNHDEMPADAGELTDDGLHNFTAITARYEAAFGPRWFSFDLPGLHVVAIDWFTHRLGIDPEAQEAWIAADLAATPGPYALLSHDLMGADFFARLPRPPIASFSGHWHTSRVVDLDGVPHFNTGPATFGGLDYSPAHVRHVTWSGEGMQVRTSARGRDDGATFRPARAAGEGDHIWAVRLDGAAHLAPPVVAGEVVLVSSKHEDVARGALEAFSVDDGARRWRVLFGSAVKAAPVVAGSLAIATAVTGETVAVDIESGAERWRATIADPTRLWCYLRPASDGRLVFVGDVAHYVALDLDDGSEVWAREDLGRRENMTPHAHPAVIGDTLVASFTAQIPDLWGLDPATGRTRWPAGVTGRSVYQGTQDEVVAMLPRTPMSAIAPDPDGDSFYVVRLGSLVERVRVADGSVVWSSPVLGWFNPGMPAVTDDAVVVTTSMGWVFCFDRATGRQRWSTEVARDAPLAFGPYRDRGPALLAGPTAVGETVVVPTGDGGLVGLRTADGDVLGRAQVAVPVLARAAVAGERAIVAGVDGWLRAVSLERAGVADCGRSSLYV